jgi:hypothetical protein
MPSRKCLDHTELTTDTLVEMLMKSFNGHYSVNKAPFLINIETSWFNRHGDMVTDALVKFISDLTSENTNRPTSKNDVYFVSISKVLDWMTYPVSIDVIANKWLWDCDFINFDYDQECNYIDQIIKNAEELEQIRLNKTRHLMDMRGEDLFRNGIFTVVIVGFTLAVLFVVLYDKLYQ